MTGLIKNVSNYSDHVHSGLSALLKRLEAPSVPVVAAPQHDVEIAMTYKITKMIPPVQPDIHECELRLNFKNAGTRRINDWGYEIEFPTPMLPPGVVFDGRVQERSDHERTLLRVSNLDPLHAGDTKEIKLPYRVTNELYRRDLSSSHGFFAQPVKARMYIDGIEVRAIEKPFDDLENF